MIPEDAISAEQEAVDERYAQTIAEEVTQRLHPFIWQRYQATRGDRFLGAHYDRAWEKLVTETREIIRLADELRR